MCARIKTRRVCQTFKCKHLTEPIRLIAQVFKVQQSFFFLQLGGEGGATTDNEMSRRVRMVLRVGAVAIVPFTATFPAVSCVCVNDL